MTTITPLSTAPSVTSGVVIETTSVDVAGGKLHVSVIRHPQAILGVTQSFVPTALGSIARSLPLTTARDDTGIPLTATATGGAMGISRTAGTSLVLAGEATSANGKTDKAMWEVVLPDSYVAGDALTVDISCIVTGAGTLTGASTTITLAAYTFAAGVEAAIAGITAAQLFTKTGEVLAFVVPGTGLVPGSPIILEIVMLVTTASGACTGNIRSVTYQA